MKKILLAIKTAWFDFKISKYPSLSDKLNFIDFLKAIVYYYKIKKDGFYKAYYIHKKYLNKN